MTSPAPRGELTGGWFQAGLAAGLVGLVLSASFFLTPLQPWPDQGGMLEAALRHSQGLGLTVLTSTSDLTRVEPRPLTYFPPLYPLVVSALLRLGAPVEMAVKALNALALLAGCLGWCRLAWPLLTGPAVRAAFCALLVLAAGGLVPKGGTADLLLWAALPAWLLLVLRASDAERLPVAVGWALVASACAGGLIALRWAAAFLVPAGCLFLLLTRVRSLGLARALATAAAHGLPATLVYAGLTLWNRQRSAQASYLDFLQPAWDFEHLLTLYPFEALTTVPLGIEALLRRAWRFVDPAFSHVLLGGLLRVGLPLVLIAVLLRAVRRSGGLAACPAQVRLGLATCAALVVFLAFMTVRYNWQATSWSYLDEARYFRPVWPAALFSWLWLTGALPPRGRRAALTILAFATVYLLQAQVRWELQRQRPQESWELTSAVLSRSAAPGLHVVLDNDVSNYVLAARPDVLLQGYPAPDDLDQLQVGRPADLWLVWRPNEPTPYVLDRDRDQKRVEALRARFGAVSVWRSSQGSYELLHARLEPGR